jgi:uncharacterized membrane protein
MVNSDQSTRAGEKDGPDAPSSVPRIARGEDPVFSAVLKPHRSLGKKGFALLMSAIGLATTGVGMAFFLAGAWPVAGFLGFDLLLLYWAFKVSYRDGRLRELIELRSDTLTLTRVLPSGKAMRWAFNSYWVRCQLSEWRGEPGELSLTSHGKRLVFGAFLSPDEKQNFAHALSGALHSLRRG